jgi:hypothetical protein
MLSALCIGSWVHLPSKPFTKSENAKYSVKSYTEE